MNLSRLVGLLSLVSLAGSCGAPRRFEVASSSSVVIDDARRALWVTSPDDDAVVEVSLEDGAERRRISIEGGPEQLAWLGERLLVSLGHGSEVALVSPESGVVTRIATPCGGTAGIVAIDALAYVACLNDDRVIELDPGAGVVLRTWSIAGGPSGLARRDDAVVVTAARTGRIVTIDTATGDASERPIVLPAGAHASQLAAVTVSEGGGVHAAYQRVEVDVDRERDPARGGYGSVLDGSPRIEPRVEGPCGDRYARFDGGALAMSGPSAIAARGGWLWIAHLYTDDVVVARCAEEGGARPGALEVFATFRVGRAPRGITLTPDGRGAFVDLGFDWALARLDLPLEASTTVLVPSWARRRTLGGSRLSADALRGRSLFFDAVDTHLTPSGVVTCGTCHPGGGEDGLAWFLHTTGVPRKLRRTPPAWAARAGLTPYHWDGQFRDGAMLAQATTRELMEGDGLLVDFDAIAAFMAEAPPPPPRPLTSSERGAAMRGEAVFTRVGCSDCHLDPMRSDGSTHEVLTPSADPDANLAAADTPPLAGIRARAPYFHDGRAATLRDTVTLADDRHGRTSALSAAELDDLVLYLTSL